MEYSSMGMRYHSLELCAAGSSCEVSYAPPFATRALHMPSRDRATWNIHRFMRYHSLELCAAGSSCEVSSASLFATPALHMPSRNRATWNIHPLRCDIKVLSHARQGTRVRWRLGRCVVSSASPFVIRALHMPIERATPIIKLDEIS